MRVIASFDQWAQPFPKLRLHIHGAPHKRMWREMLQRDREDFTRKVTRQIGNYVELPIDFPIDIEVLFVNPSSPDLDHIFEALFMMLDGPSGSFKGPSILTDDRLVQGATIRKFYNQPKTRRESERQE